MKLSTCIYTTQVDDGNNKNSIHGAKGKKDSSELKRRGDNWRGQPVNESVEMFANSTVDSMLAGSVSNGPYSKEQEVNDATPRKSHSDTMSGVKSENCVCANDEGKILAPCKPVSEHTSDGNDAPSSDQEGMLDYEVIDLLSSEDEEESSSATATQKVIVLPSSSAKESDENQQREVIDLTNTDTVDQFNTTMPPCRKRRKTVRYNLRDARLDTPVSSTEIAVVTPVRRKTRYNKPRCQYSSDLEPKTTEAGKDGVASEGEDSDESEAFNSDDESKSESDCDEDMDKKPTAKNGLSAYEQLRLERIKRNNAKLVGGCPFPNTLPLPSC